MAKESREKMIQENRIILAMLGILTIIAMGFVIYQIRSIILPFALAVFISYVLDPVIRFFEDRRIPTFLAILLALVLTFLIINLFGVVIYSSIKSFASEFPKYEARFSIFVERIITFLNIPREVFESQGAGSDRLRWLNSVQELSLHRLVLNTLGSLLNFMSNTFLVMLFLVFILIGRNQLALKVQLAFQPTTAMRIAGVLKNINRQIQKYLIAKTLISLTTGVLFGVVLSLFDVEFAMIWGLLAFLLNFIPNIGSVIATLFPISIALIQFENITGVLWLSLVLVSIQIVVGNFLDPRLVGQRLNLSPLVVLFSLMFWGWLWGIIGMFLAVPISVVIKIIFENIDSLRFIGVMMSAR